MSSFFQPAARRLWSMANCKNESTTACASLQVLRAAWCPLHENLVATDSAGLLVMEWHPLNLRASHNGGHGIVRIGDASGTVLSSMDHRVVLMWRPEHSSLHNVGCYLASGLKNMRHWDLGGYPVHICCLFCALIVFVRSHAVWFSPCQASATKIRTRLSHYQV